MDTSVQELEYAAQLLFAPHIRISAKQRQAAEQIFLTFKSQSHPYKFCQDIFRQSNNDYVLYHAVTTVKESLVKEWLLLNKDDIDFWQKFLLSFVCERKNLQRYVIERSLQCIAVLVKRGTLDNSSNDFLHHLITNIHQLFNTDDLQMKLLACSIIKALLYEYCSMGRTSEMHLSFEFHYKCKAYFESTYLQQFFIISVQTLQSLSRNTSSNSTKGFVDVISSLFSIIETILSWKFSPKNLLRIFHVRDNDDTQSLVLFKPGLKWRDTLLNGQCLPVFISLHHCVKDNERLMHQYFLCLTQFASVSGTVFNDESTTVQYLAQLLQGILELGQNYRSELSAVEASGFANVINRVLAVFPVHLFHNLPTQLVQTFLRFMSHLTQNFLLVAMRNQEIHVDDTSHMEAFDQIMIAWVNLVSSSSSFPQGFITNPCFEIFHLYVKTHISAPEGTRNSQSQQDLEEFVELRDSDLEEFDDQLNSIAQIARHVLPKVVPLLNNLLDHKIHDFLEHLRIVKEKGPLAVNTVQTENLFEDLHWLILITGYILSDKVSSETSLIPDEIIMYSISQTKLTNVEETVKHMMSLGTSGDNQVDCVTKLITSLLKIADVEKQALDAGLGPTISPELGSNIMWVLQKICDVYLMPTESEYGQVSVPMVTTFGKDGDSGRWLVAFMLQKVGSNFHHWLSEVTVLEATAQLFVTLMSNEDSARAAITCDLLAHLANDYAENNAYVKELPALVQREFSKALAVAASAMNNDNDREQYLSQILCPIKRRFDSLLTAPTFRKDSQRDVIKDEVGRLLECFRGVANTSCIRSRPLLFPFLLPVLNDCVTLLDVYHNCSETVELILSLLLDVVEYHMAYLTKDDAQKLQKICIALMEVYCKCSLGKRKRNVLAEEETFIDLLIFMKILTNILEREYLVFNDEGEEVTPSFEIADLVLYGLNILLPFITVELLKFPELKDRYFKLITLICEEHSDRICQMPEVLFANLMASLQQGLKECETDITKASLEALWGMAIDLFRQQKQEQKKPTTDRLSNALKAMLKILFNFVMFEKFDVMDLIIPVADAFWALICCHQAEYTSLVQQLLSTQTDPLVHQRLVDSFNKLTPPDLEISVEKNAKEQFRNNLDVFLANVKGLLYVK